MVDQIPPLRTSTRAGTLLGGRYRFQQLIATGGMAQVWKATDEVLGRSVAVKVLHEHLGRDESFVARFRSEAISAAKLNHRTIVAIYDTVALPPSPDAGLESPGTEAIVMELIDGETLRHLLDRPGPVDVTEVVRIVGDVCTALDIAHGAGVVHRDIKPSNILLANDGRVVVTDFGIAKAEQSNDLTGTGDVMGTAKYLAPEQVLAQPVDGRADLYSLGIVLYEAVCGRPPFDAANQLATAVARTTTDPPAPRNIHPGCSRELEAVILRAIERDPDDRYASGIDLRLALEEAIATAGVPADSEGPATPPPVDLTAQETVTQTSFAQSERGWLIPALALVLLSGGLVLAGLFFGGTDTGRDIVRDTAGVVGIGEVDEEPSDDQAEAEPEVLGETEEPPQPAGPVAVVAAAAFDPFGDNAEHDSTATLLVDGDPTTFWRSERYNSRVFGSLKEGVGAWVALDQVTELARIEVDSSATNWSANVYVATGAGATMNEWGEPVLSLSELSADADGTVIFDLAGHEGDAILIWVTDLGDGATPIRIELNELRVIAS